MPPSPQDIKTWNELNENRRNILKIYRTRAAHWVEAMQALTALLAIVTIFGGPETLQGKNIKGFQVAIPLLLALGLICLAVLHTLATNVRTVSRKILI